jgi:hypothetical protein
MCGSFESRFNRCDESEVNAARRRLTRGLGVNLAVPRNARFFAIPMSRR